MYDVKPVISGNPVDCGPTCLKMLLAYYGHDVELDTLIRECNTRFIGCTAADIRRAARLHGLDNIKVYKMDAAEAARQDRPSIVLWKYNHFCVCCGMDDDGKVIICNPDLGRYRMSEETFTSMYSGIALFNGNPQDATDDFWGENEPENDYFDTDD